MNTTRASDHSHVVSPRPRVGITIGDPAGVGPELIVRSWCQDRFHQMSRLVAIGPSAILRQAVRQFAPAIQVVTVEHADEAISSPSVLPCLSTSDIDRAALPGGTYSQLTGQISYGAVVRAAEWAMAGELDGLVTCPISKAAWHVAGVGSIGHTELLARQCGVADTAMMLYLPPGHAGVHGALGVVHVTLHTSLRRAIDEISTSLIVDRARMLDDIMQCLRTDRTAMLRPRLGICALNPHAGEDGLFGDEESRLIAPAVQQLAAMSYHVSGPHPADTLFARAVRGEFDGVVAMVHDQGHLPIKLLAMHSAVNITLGLPIVRTSVAHGTAFDIAWQGSAEITGMQSALACCVDLVNRRHSDGATIACESDPSAGRQSERRR